MIHTLSASKLYLTDGVHRCTRRRAGQQRTHWDASRQTSRGLLIIMISVCSALWFVFIWFSLQRAQGPATGRNGSKVRSDAAPNLWVDKCTRVCCPFQLLFFIIFFYHVYTCLCVLMEDETVHSSQAGLLKSDIIWSHVTHHPSSTNHNSASNAHTFLS